MQIFRKLNITDKFEENFLNMQPNVSKTLHNLVKLGEILPKLKESLPKLNENSPKLNFTGKFICSYLRNCGEKKACSVNFPYAGLTKFKIRVLHKPV